MNSVFVLEGFTSDGESFDFPGVRFTDRDDAIKYAVNYASCVTGTDEVDVTGLDSDSPRVRASGREYSESVYVREIVR